MTEHTALRGKRVVVTRSAEQAPEFRSLLEEVGAVPIEIPTIEIQPPKEWSEVDQALDRIADYKLLVFTSGNAVRGFMARLKETGKALPPKIAVAAVGPKTAQALKENGTRPTVMPEQAGAAEELIDTISERLTLRNAKILFPRALEARDVLPNALRAKGAIVDVVPVYRTVASKAGKRALERILDGECVDWLTFASGSAVRSFFELCGAERAKTWFKTNRVKVAAIGRVTAESLAEYGVSVTVRPDSPTLAGMVEAMKRAERGE
ncbi:MAG TPA: uroporphyrinogen-III synthase [Bdellovibrionota bacterium]|nr:uroporphyrinogen-III synthase [Bdellovibrionota bacterium]